MLNEREYRLDIQGYYSDDVRSRFPHSPGIYFVYRGVLDSAANTCTLRQLLYIGQTHIHVSFTDSNGNAYITIYHVGRTKIPKEPQRIVNHQYSVPTIYQQVSRTSIFE